MPLAQCSPQDPPEAISNGLSCFPPVPDQRQPSPSRVLLRTGAWLGAGRQAEFPHLEAPDERCTSASKNSRGARLFLTPGDGTLRPKPSAEAMLGGRSLRRGDRCPMRE
jgi:hypothetical protein